MTETVQKEIHFDDKRKLYRGEVKEVNGTAVPHGKGTMEYVHGSVYLSRCCDHKC